MLDLRARTGYNSYEQIVQDVRRVDQDVTRRHMRGLLELIAGVSLVATVFWNAAGDGQPSPLDHQPVPVYDRPFIQGPAGGSGNQLPATPSTTYTLY